MLLQQITTNSGEVLGKEVTGRCYFSIAAATLVTVKSKHGLPTQTDQSRVSSQSQCVFELVQAETIQAVDQISRRPVLYFCVAGLGFLVKIGYFP